LRIEPRRTLLHAGTDHEPQGAVQRDAGAARDARRQSAAAAALLAFAFALASVAAVLRLSPRQRIGGRKTMTQLGNVACCGGVAST